LPAPRRCYELGKLIREIADKASERIAILATGGLSHFPGSPRIGEIDTGFDQNLLRKMKEGQGSELADLTLEQLRESGNTEFLNWMVTIGSVGSAKASETFYMPDHVATGWGFASWHF
jgi:2,3-dihydroxyphenylpropionate 1,2-dioxygenase